MTFHPIFGRSLLATLSLFLFATLGTIGAQDLDLDASIEQAKAAIAQMEAAQAAAEAKRAAPNVGVQGGEEIQTNINYVWTITAAILVTLMQLGFCMVEIGLSRARNSINVAMKNVLDFSASIISFLLFGFTFMFGVSEGGWIGGQDFALWQLPGDSPVWTFFFFQAVFVATACTIASGAMAERTKFVGYLCYTVILSGLIYPIFGHWAWGSFGESVGFGGSSGWLQKFGFHDFAGSTVVHGIGGASALAGIIIVGSRIGRFDENGNPRYLPGHNLPFVAFGTLVLSVGWFGFNAGSLVEGTVELGRVCVNTAVGASAGCIAAMGAFWIIRGVPSPLMALNGVLGGLVAITASADVINPLSAMLIGAIGGVIATTGSILLERMKLDDVVGAVPVHLFAGIWGTIAVALFHENGFSMERLGIQVFGTLAITIGAFGVALVLFKVIDTLIGLRVDDEEQEDGLDFAEHSTNSYPDFQTTDL